MASRTTLDVVLAPDLEQFVSAMVASGRYQSTDEVICQGLRLLQCQETTRQAQLARLRSQINLGLEQAKRGELLDGVDVFEELEKRFLSATLYP